MKKSQQKPLNINKEVMDKKKTILLRRQKEQLNNQQVREIFNQPQSNIETCALHRKYLERTDDKYKKIKSWNDTNLEIMQKYDMEQYIKTKNPQLVKKRLDDLRDKNKSLNVEYLKYKGKRYFEILEHEKPITKEARDNILVNMHAFESIVDLSKEPQEVKIKKFTEEQVQFNRSKVALSLQSYHSQPILGNKQMNQLIGQRQKGQQYKQQIQNLKKINQSSSSDSSFIQQGGNNSSGITEKAFRESSSEESDNEIDLNDISYDDRQQIKNLKNNTFIQNIPGLKDDKQDQLQQQQNMEENLFKPLNQKPQFLLNSPRNVQGVNKRVSELKIERSHKKNFTAINPLHKNLDNSHNTNHKRSSFTSNVSDEINIQGGLKFPENKYSLQEKKEIIERKIKKLQKNKPKSMEILPLQQILFYYSKEKEQEFEHKLIRQNLNQLPSKKKQALEDQIHNNNQRILQEVKQSLPQISLPSSVQNSKFVTARNTKYSSFHQTSSPRKHKTESYYNSNGQFSNSNLGSSIYNSYYNNSLMNLDKQQELKEQEEAYTNSVINDKQVKSLIQLQEKIDKSTLLKAGFSQTKNGNLLNRSEKQKYDANGKIIVDMTRIMEMTKEKEKERKIINKKVFGHSKSVTPKCSQTFTKANTYRNLFDHNNNQQQNTSLNFSKNSKIHRKSISNIDCTGMFLRKKHDITQHMTTSNLDTHLDLYTVNNENDIEQESLNNPYECSRVIIENKLQEQNLRKQKQQQKIKILFDQKEKIENIIHPKQNKIFNKLTNKNKQNYNKH